MMKFRSKKALREAYPKAESIVQVRIITKAGSEIDAEGPCTSAEATRILQLATGQTPAPTKGSAR